MNMQIVLTWIKKVAWQRRFPKEKIAATWPRNKPNYNMDNFLDSSWPCSTSCLDELVRGSESDIDALCVVPFFATMAEDFFVVLHNMLKSRPEVSEIHCVKDAKVPLIRFEFDGISIDLPYAQLKLSSVPENVDVLNPYFLRGVNETSWKSLSGVRANKRILQLVPNLENFQPMLQCLLGFLGGVHLAILAAFVCQKHPNASLNSLIMNFFQIDAIEIRSLMPIQLPCSPYEYCHSNVTRSTFHRIRAEFLRGHNRTRGSVFEHFPYPKEYTRFVKIYLSASNQDDLGDWVGWVKSLFCSLLTKLEEVQGFCDPNPVEHVDMDVIVPNVVFYRGLNPSKSSFIDIRHVKEDFMKNLKNGYQGSLPKSALLDTRIGKWTKECWKILDYNLRRTPMYSQHLPHYFVGYVATDREVENPSDGG
ncbi:hypothetical protein I3842_Q121600 [Carya illinoinensis]|uniref:polynucleotide adenylyltransferase n=1 Tax=Carya illinoinensis TaxID=32201 RepID=A0A922A0C7_CARIL|nr:hypothetical protein I3842_Q121600 [Carya illinoinensis]